MTDLTPQSKPAGTSPETSAGGPAERPAGARTDTSTGTPGGTESGTEPDTARGTRARPLSDKATAGGPDQDRYTTSGTPAPTTGDDRTATARRHDAGHHDDRRDDHHDDRQGTDRDTTDWLLPRDECDRLAGQMRHAVSGFVDGPGAAVEEADRVLEEAAARFTDAVAKRRRSLRRAWQPIGGGAGGGRNGGSGTPNADTEVLRLALRDYRELTDRLLSR